MAKASRAGQAPCGVLVGDGPERPVIARPCTRVCTPAAAPGGLSDGATGRGVVRVDSSDREPERLSAVLLDSVALAPDQKPPLLRRLLKSLSAHDL
jgi:hypothetical protein